MRGEGPGAGRAALFWMLWLGKAQQLRAQNPGAGLLTQTASATGVVTTGKSSKCSGARFPQATDWEHSRASLGVVNE